MLTWARLMHEPRLLDIKHIRAGYDELSIIHDVDLYIANQEIVGLIGRNGAGKTTLLRAIMGLATAGKGEILFGGVDITRTNAMDRAVRGIGYVPQGRRLFKDMSVMENISISKRASLKKRNLGLDAIIEIFPMLKDILEKRAGSLSGGQQQQVAIARALYGYPELLLMDEPSEGIQPSIIQILEQKIKEINKKYGISILIVEQNLQLIRALSDRCYVLKKGKLEFEMRQTELCTPGVLENWVAI